MDLSVIIVNYNVKEFLSNCLEAISRAAEGISYEIIVVDNASSDGSRAFLEPRFPQVQFIWNEQNVGFGAANNQAIGQAKGEYILLLNPDTLLQEDTLQVMLEHMKTNPKCGVSGCKILNADGSFAPESRRSVPTLANSLYKTLGLTALFPKSKRFGAYYLGWLSEDEAGAVPVLSGSFMFFRGDVLRSLGGFDERFFMYGEDIDLSVRVCEAGWEIEYVPTTSIIHYKGESSRKDDLRYIRHFNEAMYLFYEKHYSQGVYRLFRVVIRLAVAVRTLTSFVSQKLKRITPYLLDLFWVNVALFAGLAIRWGFQFDKLAQIDYSQFVWLNALITLLVLLFALTGETGGDKKLKISSALKRVAASFAALILITFFIRDLAFSRIIVIVAFVLSMGLVPLSRLVFGSDRRGLSSSSGWSRPRILLVGVSSQTADVIKKIEAAPDLPGVILGIIHQDEWPYSGQASASNSGSASTFLPSDHPIPIIGSISQLPSLIQSMSITHVIVLMEALHNREVMQIASRLQGNSVQIALIPREMDLLLGKEMLEYFEDLPLLDLPVGFLQSNRNVTKRTMDLVISSALLSVTAIPALFSRLSAGKLKEREVEIPYSTGNRIESVRLLSPLKKFNLYNLWKLLSLVWRGKMSLVGSDLSRTFYEKENEETQWLQSGLSSYASLYPSRIRSVEDLDRMDQAYARHYSIWLDLEILIRSLKKGPFQLWKGKN